ncbi:hypothetical protein KQI52_05585 [bacterium]|nr:hypothetical protein [bacterium]
MKSAKVVVWIAIVVLSLVSLAHADNGQIFSKEEVWQIVPAMEEGFYKIQIILKRGLYLDLSRIPEIELDDNWKLRDGWGHKLTIREITPKATTSGISQIIITLKKDPLSSVTLDFKNNRLGVARRLNTIASDGGRIAYTDHDAFYTQAYPTTVQVERVLDQAAMVSLSYDLQAVVIGYNALRTSEFKPLAWRYQLNLGSEGTFGSLSRVRNGTESFLKAQATRFHMTTFNRTLQVETYVGYLFETALDQRTEQMLQVRNKTLGAGFEVEIPYTNFLAKLELDKQMTRDVAPMRFRYDHYWSGKDHQGWSTPSRNIIELDWELPFSRFLILDLGYQYNTFAMPLPIFVQGDGGAISRERIPDASYYHVRVAQELAFLLDAIGDIPLLDIKDSAFIANNFFYFEYASGRQAPAFENRIERKVGISVSF